MDGLSVVHGRECKVQRVERILDKILAAAFEEPTASEDRSVDQEVQGAATEASRDLSDAAIEARKRIAICISFCAGIPTDILKRQLPLASSKRVRFEEIQYLCRALPWLHEFRGAVDL